MCSLLCSSPFLAQGTAKGTTSKFTGTKHGGQVEEKAFIANHRKRLPITQRGGAVVVVVRLIPRRACRASLCNGGCRGEGALNRKIANHRKRLPITQRGGAVVVVVRLIPRRACRASLCNGGCRGEGALNRKIANHRKRLPITQGGGVVAGKFSSSMNEWPGFVHLEGAGSPSATTRPRSWRWWWSVVFFFD